MFISEQAARSIVWEIKSITGYNINIMDERGIIFASTDPTRIGQLHRGAYRILKEGLGWLTIREDEQDDGMRQGINLPIELNQKRVGVIGITGAAAEVSRLDAVIKRMTEIMIQDAQRQEEENFLESARRCFVENWLFSDDPDLSELSVRGKLLGIDLSAQWTVAILEIPEARDNRDTPEFRSSLLLKYTRPWLKNSPNSLCAVINQRLLLLFPQMDQHHARSASGQICDDLERVLHTKLCGGISSGGRQGLEVRRSYREAQIAERVSRDSGRLLCYNEVSLEFLADSIPEKIRRDLSEMVFSRCTEQERQEMVETIRLFFQFDGDVKRAAEALYVHKNTFHYRLHKIKDKVGYNIHVPKDMVFLYLAGICTTLQE